MTGKNDMDTSRNLTLIVADDHGIVREGIAACCRDHPEISIVGQCGDGERALALILDLKPDFAILDLNMSGMSGLEVVRRAREAGSRSGIVILSVTREEKTIRDVFSAGANGYVLKDGPSRHLFDAMQYILDGGQYLTPLLRRAPSADPPNGKIPREVLSSREYEVFVHLVEGERPRDIARKLDISPKTVDTYRANILRKLDVDGIAGLVRFAIHLNRLEPGGE